MLADSPDPTPQPLPGSRRYRAFLSYRHADNAQEGRRWAEWLHRSLERYEIPRDLIGRPNQRGEPIPESLYPIFRDEDELPADADLAAGIRRAIERSDCMVVLCSPRSAVSPWVRKEIREFKELGKSDRILAVIIAGEPNADDPQKARDGIGVDEECFPHELRHGIPRADGTVDWDGRTEPLAADLRPRGLRAEGFVTAAAYKEHLTQTSSYAPARIAELADAYGIQLEHSRLKIIAGILGIALSQLEDRDARHRAEKAEAEAAHQKEIAERERELADKARVAADRLRKRNRILRVAAASILLLAGVAAWFAYWAKTAAKVAVKEKARAESLNAQAARVARLMAVEKLDGGLPADALAYLAAAIQYEPQYTHAAERAVFTLNDWPYPLPDAILRLEKGESAVAVSDGLRVVLTDSIDGRYRVREFPSGIVLSTLAEEDGMLVSAYLSPDGRRAVGVSESGIAGVWDTASGRRLVRIAGMHKTSWDTAFSPDGRLVAMGEDERAAGLYDTATGARLAPLEQFTNDIRRMEFSADSRRLLVVATLGSPGVWDAATGRCLCWLEKLFFSVDVKSAWFSEDGKFVACAAGKLGAGIWDAETGKIKLVLDPGDESFQDIAISHDSRRLATITERGKVAIWDAATGASLHSNDDKPYGFGGSVIFSSDGKRLLILFGSQVARIWEVESGVELAVLIGHAATIRSGGFLGDSGKVWCNSDDGTLRSWPIDGWQTATKFRAVPKETQRLAASPNGRWLAWENFEDEVWIHDRDSGEAPRLLGVTNNWWILPFFSPDGSTIAAGLDETTIRVWECDSARVVGDFKIPEEFYLYPGFSPDGRLISVQAHKKAVHILDASTGQRVAEILPTGAEIVGSAFTPDSQRFAVGLSSGEIWLRDVRAGTQVVVKTPKSSYAESIAFSRDGDWMAATGVGVGLWSMTSGTPALMHQLGDGGPNALAFRPDGAQLASITYNHGPVDKGNTIRLWDTRTGSLALTIRNEMERDTRPAFSPCGRRLLVWNRRGQVRIYDAVTGVSLLETYYPGLNEDGIGWVGGADKLRLLRESSISSVLTLLDPAEGPPPAWFPEFLHYVSQHRLDENGESKQLALDDWLAAKENLLPVARAGQGDRSAYMRILRRYLRLAEDGK